jgi:hypothetical protein
MPATPKYMLLRLLITCRAPNVGGRCNAFCTVGSSCCDLLLPWLLKLTTQSLLLLLLLRSSMLVFLLLAVGRYGVCLYFLPLSLLPVLLLLVILLVRAAAAAA